MCMFIAAMVPGANAIQASDAVAIASENAEGNISLPTNIHCTIKFIGEIDHSKCVLIASRISALARITAPFRIATDRWAMLRGGTLVAEIGQGRDRCVALMHSVERSVETEGIAKEAREKRPHITVGRKVRLKKPLEQWPPPPFDLSVGALTLMQSVREHGMLVYKPFSSSVLRG